ncbi:MAG TPA: TssQ family T6SS-associated lipoprotein [Burkholderiales bacterium]
MLAAPTNNKAGKKMKNNTLALAVVLALSGCSAPPLGDLQANLKALAMAIFASTAQTALREALNRYEEGDYAAAEESLQEALQHGLEPGDQVVAHKHLAFIHCATGRMQECRAQFQLALRANPGVDLDPAEAGHPAWGPVFRSLAR